MVAKTSDVPVAFGGDMATNIGADHCCWRVIDPDTALGSSMSQDISIASGGRAGYSHQRAWFYGELENIMKYVIKTIPFAS